MEHLNYVIPPDIPAGMTLPEYRRQKALTAPAHPFTSMLVIVKKRGSVAVAGSSDGPSDGSRS